ncbi:MAG TPA: MFS transporter [Jiangellaceae bacterium]|nr:MFS transporter [Jiangellaceae bacterium]
MSHDTTAVDATAPQPKSAGNDHGHRHLGIALAIITAAQLMIVLDASVVNIALPSIQADLGFSDANLSWVVTAYVLAFGGLMLLGGRLGDLLGRRRIFMVGIAVFTLASFLGGIAQGEATLLIARALQGVGAAIASPTALALITTTFPAGPPRNRAMAVYAAMSGMGAAIGLIVGGSLTEVSWRWTLFINIPIGILLLVLVPRFLGESPRQHGQFDFAGAAVGTAGLVSLVYGLTHAASHEWTSPTTIITLALGIGLLLLFVAAESRTEHPLLPMRILADRTRAVSFVSMLIMGAAIFSMFFFISLFVQQVLGYSPLKAGIAFLPFTAGIIVAAQTASALASRVDPRWIAGVGALVSAVGMWGYTQLDVDSTYVADLLPWILVQSVGMGLVFVPLTLTAVSRVAREDSGVGSAVLNTMQQVGGALGLATLGTVAVQSAENKAEELGQLAAAGNFDPQLIGAAAQTYGATQAFWVAALMILVGAAIVFLGLNIKHEELTADGPVAEAVPA